MRQGRTQRLAATWLLAGTSFVALGCDTAGSEPPSRGGSGAGGDRVIPVEVVTAALGTAARSVTSTGTVEPLRTIGVNSQLSGALLEVAVQEGDVVRQGSVLARIDSRELTAQLASAEAALELARRTAERSELLRAQGIVTMAEYERDEAALAAASATRDQLRTRLSFATLRSPIAGVVLEQRVETGDLVAPQTRLFTVADVSTLVVRVPVSEMDVAALTEGDRADVLFDALPGRGLQGRIRRVFPAADTVTRLVPVEVALTGAAAREVRPGFLARVTFRLDSRANVLMVPVGAVVQRSTGTAVFVVKDGRANLQPVQRGGTYEGRTEIVRGLAAGDSVVVAGSTTLRDGAAVRVVQPPTLDAPTTAVPATVGAR